jgi:hypothetical protein
MLEEIGYIGLASVFATLSGVLATYIMGRRYFSDEKIMDKFAMILENVVSDTQLQQKVYQIGAILGSGIARGTGLQGGGKMKLGDIIAQGASAFIGNMFGQNKEQPNAMMTQENPQTPQRKPW